METLRELQASRLTSHAYMFFFLLLLLFQPLNHDTAFFTFHRLFPLNNK